MDWATAHQGHPLADVARTTLLIKIGQVPFGGRLDEGIAGEEAALREEIKRSLTALGLPPTRPIG